MDFFSNRELAGIVITTSIVYAAVIMAYRITLHPLAKYPGPLLNSISGWPDALSAIRGSRHIDFHQLHSTYGDVVRYAPNGVSFATSRALQDIYVDRHANVIKTGWTEAAIAINRTMSTQATPDRKQHAVKRRLLSQAFSESALRSAETYVLSRVRAWCDLVGADNEKTTGWAKLDIGHWSALLTLDVLGELCFGASFGSMEAGGSTIGRMLIASAQQVQNVAYLPIRHLLYPILGQPSIASKIGGQTTLDRINYRVQIRKLVDNRRALEQGSEKSSRKDFFHYLLNAKDPETGIALGDRELEAEAALLVAAGMDTSSTTLSALFFYLCRNPRVLAKLTSEIREAFTDVEEIETGPKLSSLRYLRACIDEAMRMTPPVPGLLSRIVLPGGASIDGRQFNEKTVVGVSAYVIHHNETYYPKCFSYIPERWIEDSKEAPFPVTSESVEQARSAFFSFSLGPRGCLGKNMAYMELLLAAGRLLWLYDLRATDATKMSGGRPGKEKGREREEEFQAWDVFVTKRQGPVIELKKRAATAA